MAVEPDLNLLVVLLQVVRMEEYGLEVTDRKKKQVSLAGETSEYLVSHGKPRAAHVGDWNGYNSFAKLPLLIDTP